MRPNAVGLWVFALILVVSAAPASAQNEAILRGQLVAQADGSALAQGTITLRSTTGSLETGVDAGGRFVFSRVTPGAYVLTAASQGFAERQVSISLAPRDVQSVTLALALPGLEVNVTVRGEPVSIPTTRSPSSTVLSSERISGFPMSQHATLPDAIVTAAPGMIRGHDDFVHIRGEEVALNPLINGVAFWENAHAVFSAGFSPDVIDTANVMTGGFPAEYGNRFGGVVDIVTKSGFQLDGAGSMTLNAGEAARRTVLGEYGGQRERFGYYVFGSLLESDRFLSPPDPTAIHDHGVGGHALFQGDTNLGTAGMLRATIIADGVNLEIPKTAEDRELRPQADARQRNRQQTAIVGWTRAASGFLLDATAVSIASACRQPRHTRARA
jgi:hypothetical protein